MADRCKACNAEMLWALTESGKNIPLDPEPVEHGNLCLAALDPGGPMVVHYIQDGETIGPLVPRYRSHFATCSRADEFRKNKGEHAKSTGHDGNGGRGASSRGNGVAGR